MMDIRLNTSNIPQQMPPLAPARDVGGAAQEPTPSVTVSKRAFPDPAGAEEVRAFVKERDGVRLASEIMDGWLEKAVSCLEPLPESKEKSYLATLPAFVRQRNR